VVEIEANFGKLGELLVSGGDGWVFELVLEFRDAREILGECGSAILASNAVMALACGSCCKSSDEMDKAPLLASWSNAWISLVSRGPGGSGRTPGAGRDIGTQHRKQGGRVRADFT
jgi:hypothetical protein